MHEGSNEEAAGEGSRALVARDAAGVTDVGGADAEMADAPGQKGEGIRLRKPYTITKRRESWTQDEHRKFVQALQLYDRDWKKIESHVGTKSVIQIRSHAQKYFLKVQKNGTGEHVPPPRPKRKSAKPYPKAPVSGKAAEPVAPETTAVSKPAKTSAQTGQPGRGASGAGRRVGGKFKSGGDGSNEKSARGGECSHTKNCGVKGGKAPGADQGFGRPGMTTDARAAAATTRKLGMKRSSDVAMKRYGSGKGHQSDRSAAAAKGGGSVQWNRASTSTPVGSHYPVAGGGTDAGQFNGMPGSDQPDFSVVYGYLSSLFEPGSNRERIEGLVSVSPIDRHTIVLLMKNLISNLQNPQMWNEQVRLLSQGLPNFVLEKQFK